MKKGLLLTLGILILLINQFQTYAKNDQKSWWQPKPGTSWQWQLKGQLNTDYKVDVYDIDLFDNSKEAINDLQKNGIKVICYFSAGSYENWREDSKDFPKEILGKELDGWPDERWLDISKIEILKPLITKRLDLALEKGCNAIEPDNVDGYLNNTGFSLNYKNQLTYNKWLANQAHQRNLAIGLKNDLEQIKDLVKDFDFAVNEQCFEFNECKKLLPFIKKNEAVFGVEYNLEKNKFCKKATKMKFDWLKMDLELDGNRDSCKEAKIKTAKQATKAGEIKQNETWSGEVLITQQIIIPENTTVTIEPGTKIKFKHYRGYKNQEEKIGIEVNGTLKAIGTPEQQIWFTSDADKPINGDWAMLRFTNSKNSILKYAIVEFAQQGINLWNSDTTVSHSIVRWNNWEGIYLESYSKPLIEYNLIYQNGYNGIAMEQFNDATVKFNTIKNSGTLGIHVDASNALVENNYITGNKGGQLSVDDHATMTAKNNILEGDSMALRCGEGENTVTTENNEILTKEKSNCPEDVFNEEVQTAKNLAKPQYDYSDTKIFDLGYTPGDQEKDQYLYIYPEKDQTREVIKKIGKDLGLTWSLAFDGKYLWTATLWGSVYQIDPENGEIKKQWQFPGPQAWGMTFDGKDLWINDFAEKKVYQMDTDGKVLSSFKIPDETGGAKGLASDEKNLYVMGWTSPTIYVVDKKGKLLKTIELKDIWANGGLAYDGKNFWIPCGGRICKFDQNGKWIGWIYAASEGTWDLAWDGKYLWATQRTNENWQDEKIYQLKILNDSMTK